MRSPGTGALGVGPRLGLELDKVAAPAHRWIKVLHRDFTTDGDRLARFEREARLLATLNHPNIGAIYGLEDAGDERALVLELVEGETLADRIARGPLPVKDALIIAQEMAQALDAAHEKGITHRDLKPANFMLTSGGVVKVLDFGLAKAGGDGPLADLSRSPTVTAGARGYVLKSDADENLIAAVDSLRQHKPFLTSQVTEFVLDDDLRRTDPRADGAARAVLTGREREIVQLVAEGRSNKEMAATLGVSVKRSKPTARTS